jgi:hypothetical protein
VDSKADAGLRSRILVWMLQIVIGVVSMTSTVHAAECARLGVGLARRHHIEWFGTARGT